MVTDGPSGIGSGSLPDEVGRSVGGVPAWVRRPASPREVLFARLAFAAIALFVVHDTMIDLRPGVSRGDHLSALIVPLLVLAAPAWGWPRMRSGWRALLLGTLGAVAIAGAVAVRGEGGWSWLLLAIPGVGMTVASVAIAYVGRRRGGRVIARRVAIAFGLLFWAWWVIVPLAMAVVATSRSFDDAERRYAIGPGQREVTIETRDGLELAATYVPSRDGAVVITYPTKEWTAAESQMLARAGYGVLALEMRGYGGSEGDVNRFGWDSVADIEAAAGFLERDGVNRIGALGSSVGGEVLIDAAADDDRLRAVVSEGAGERSVRETLAHGPAAALALPAAVMQTAAVAVLSGDAPPPSLKSEVARISPRAVFLIDAENGGGGEELNAVYFDAAGEPKSAWTVPGASHTEGLATRPGEYQRRVTSFFDEQLPAAGR